jgi:hypothetical protein
LKEGKRIKGKGERRKDKGQELGGWKARKSGSIEAKTGPYSAFKLQSSYLPDFFPFAMIYELSAISCLFCPLIFGSEPLTASFQR